jgi:hypothetical protein
VRRRDFIAILGGAAAGWSRAAVGQQTDKVRRIGLFSAGAERDPEIQAEIAALVQGLQQLGWMEGKNVRIDRRFIGANYSQLSTVVKELIDLQPDVIFAISTPVAAAFRQRSPYPSCLSRSPTQSPLGWLRTSPIRVAISRERSSSCADHKRTQACRFCLSREFPRRPIGNRRHDQEVETAASTAVTLRSAQL